MRSALIPGAPLRSVTLPTVAMMLAMASLSETSSEDASVMIPSPLKRVFAKIAAMSAVSERLMTFPSFPRFSRICFADLYSFRPVAFPLSNDSMSKESLPSRIRSGLLTAEVIHLAVLMMSLTVLIPLQVLP